MSKTAIEKMVEWLEIFDQDVICAGGGSRGGFPEIIGEARRLASLEAKEAEHKCQYGKTFHGDNTEQLVLSVVEWLKKVSPSSLEAKEKPTAPAELVARLWELIDLAKGSGADEHGNYWIMGDVIESTLSRYRPVPVVKEKGEVVLWDGEILGNYVSICGPNFNELRKKKGRLIFQPEGEKSC